MLALLTYETIPQIISSSLKIASVASSGAHFPGTHALEKKSDTAASSSSMTVLLLRQSGFTSLSAINYSTVSKEYDATSFRDDENDKM